METPTAKPGLPIFAVAVSGLVLFPCAIGLGVLGQHLPHFPMTLNAKQLAAWLIEIAGNEVMLGFFAGSALPLALAITTFGWSYWLRATRLEQAITLALAVAYLALVVNVPIGLTVNILVYFFGGLPALVITSVLGTIALLIMRLLKVNHLWGAVSVGALVGGIVVALDQLFGSHAEAVDWSDIIAQCALWSGGGSLIMGFAWHWNEVLARSRPPRPA
jgi:hypothetical protein